MRVIHATRFGDPEVLTLAECPPLAQAAEAHAAIEGRAAVAKTLLLIQSAGYALSG